MYKIRYTHTSGGNNENLTVGEFTNEKHYTMIGEDIEDPELKRTFWVLFSARE